jgi:Arylsulfotransferase (ASST)
MGRGARRASLAVLILLLAGPARALAAPGSLHVVPFPGTPDAPSATTIIFSSLHPSDIAWVTVTGSRSGRHGGQRSALPDGAGTAFRPTRPFAPGEQVTVTATLRSARAGTASGAPGATVLRFSFGVAVSAGRVRLAASGEPTPRAVSASDAGAPGRTMSFHSQGFHPPTVTLTPDADTGSGDIFLTPKHAAHYHLVFQGGPMILDSQGGLVWFHPYHGVSTNLQVERYQGHAVLTWWQTNATGGRGKKHNGVGQDVIMSRSYRTLAVLHAGNGLQSDSHEFQITPQGTALIDCVHKVRTNLTKVGGPASGDADDYVIQELDIKTGKVLWEWHALGHIPINAAYIPYRSTRAFDFFHLNSIQQLPNHNLLISARHTWGVYEIDKSTGKVIWTLGGKYSNFKFAPGAKFEWQHDARLIGHKVSLFDDASNGSGQQENESSAKVLRLNFATHRATLIKRYVHAPPLITPSQGSAQILPNDNMFVGWGGQPVFSEYRPNGHQVFTGSFPAGAQSYRAYRFPWSAQPQTPPSLALQADPGGSVTVYASWNGATDVAAWRVLGGPTPHTLTTLGGRKRTGFETAMKLQSEPAYFEVQALSSHGSVLGTSPVHADPGHVAVFGPDAFVSSGRGVGDLAVGCFTRQACHLSLRISSGKSLLAQSARPLPRGTGALMSFRLSAAGRRALNHASNHRLQVAVTLRDSSGASATRALTLIPYSVSGSGPSRSTSQSPTIQLAQTTGFVSSRTGVGQIMAACYAAAPCQVNATVSANGVQIASMGPERLGVNELGELYFKLTDAGRAMLGQASGNQLPAQITITDGSDTATGQIALVGYR